MTSITSSIQMKPMHLLPCERVAATSKAALHHDFAEIESSLFIGNQTIAADKQSLKDHGVTHIVNCTEDIPCFYPESFTYLRLPLEDSPVSKITPHLNEAVLFIKNAISSNAKVLIHCEQGISRSAAITVAFLIDKYRAGGYASALKRIQTVYPKANPNFWFQKELLDFYITKLMEGSAKPEAPNTIPQAPQAPFAATSQASTRNLTAKQGNPQIAFLEDRPPSSLITTIGASLNAAFQNQEKGHKENAAAKLSPKTTSWVKQVCIESPLLSFSCLRLCQAIMQQRFCNPESDLQLNVKPSHPNLCKTITADLTPPPKKWARLAADTITWKVYNKIHGEGSRDQGYYKGIHWGKSGAGALILSPDPKDPQVLLLKRAKDTVSGELWSIPGGARKLIKKSKELEDPIGTAIDETIEEAGVLPRGRLFTNPIVYLNDGTEYRTFVLEIVLKDLYEPRLNKEHTAWKWFTSSAALASSDVHPGVKFALNQLLPAYQQSKQTSEQMIQEIFEALSK